MVNLKAKPYYLDEEGISWVEETLESMTIEEKNRTIIYKYGFFDRRRIFIKLIRKI